VININVLKTGPAGSTGNRSWYRLGLPQITAGGSKPDKTRKTQIEPSNWVRFVETAQSREMHDFPPFSFSYKTVH